jgi:hypothetical protein
VVGRVTTPLFISMFYSDARNATNVSATPVTGPGNTRSLSVPDFGSVFRAAALTLCSLR